MLTLPALALLTASAVTLVAVVTVGNRRGDRRSLATRADVLETLGRTAQHRRCADELRRVAPHPSVRTGAVTILGPVDKPQPAATDRPSEPVVSPVAHLALPRRVVDPTTPGGPAIPVRPTHNPAEPALGEPLGAPHPPVPTPAAVLPHATEPPRNITSELSRAPSPGGRRVLAAALSVAVMATGVVALGVWTPSPQSRAALEAAATRNEVTPVSDPATPGASQPPETTQVPPPSPLATRSEGADTESVSAAPPFTLDLAAGNPAWVRVATTGGNTLFEGTMEPDDTVQLRPLEPVEVRMGNSAGVLMAIDGRLVGHSRTEGQPLTVTVRPPPAPGPLPNP